MTASKKRKGSALSKALKRRRARPRSTMLDPSIQSLRRQLVRNHEDVLQNLEFALIKAANEDDAIDDFVLHEACRCLVTSSDPPRGHISYTHDIVQQIMALRDDVSDDLWRNAARVVMHSIRRHSDLRPGSVSYLEFVGQFIM